LSTVKVIINGREYEAKSGSTVLETCKSAGVDIPTLCYHPRLESTGACRICAIEVAGYRNLQAACVTAVQEGMQINTNTLRVTSARKMNLALLLSNHPNKCMTCESNGNCELQDLIYEYGIEDSFAKVVYSDELIDDSSPAITRDLNKCISCSRCVRACSQLQDMNIYSMAYRGANSLPLTAFNKNVFQTNCIGCGQCSLFCPVGAITENSAVRKVREVIDSGKYIMVAQTAPATRIAISEELGLEPGRISTGLMVSALKALGFQYVFDTNFSADLTIMEEGSELLKRVSEGGVFPMFTSCCPGWINLVEQEYPELIPNLSSAKSPQQMLGAVVKTYFAKKIGVDPDKIYMVSIMPCTAKKQEAQREQQLMENGKPYVDLVLTTRELGKRIRLSKITLEKLSEIPYDDPLGKSTGAAVIFGATGGVMEAALRTAYELSTGKQLAKLDFTDVRGIKGIKETEVDLDGKVLRIAVAHGGANIRALLKAIKEKTVTYDFVEIMACPGGCIGGGGEPYSNDPEIIQKRMKGIYKADELNTIRKSHENPAIQELYKEYFEAPLSHRSHKLLHTHYVDRSKEKV
jgi:NADH-quinone oxidoreductase subunit G